MQKRYIKRSLLVLTFATIGFGASAQTGTVDLGQVVIGAGQTHITAALAGKPNIIQVRSSNPSVATAIRYRTAQVEVIAKGPGKSIIEFFDNSTRTSYRLTAWVEPANPTGGGGGGYDARKTQLPQVVMLINHTENVRIPGPGPHQLSGVVSSNASVATARTDTNNTIQVYSAALGDTFIDLRDNATGTTYQVHVWVKRTLDQPPAASPSGPDAGTKLRKPVPTAPPRAMPRSVGGSSANAKIDQCVVGTWISRSVKNDFIHWDNGGEGIVLTIKADGHVEINYANMTPNTKPGERIEWKGAAAGRIITADHSISVASVDGSKILVNYVRPKGNNYTGELEGLGNVLQSVIRYDYTCDRTTLALSSHAFSTVFERQE